MGSAIEIFRVGTHTDMSGKTLVVSRDDLVNLASGYDTKAYMAPIVVGHPTLEAPAYGWVSGLSVDDAGTLKANLEKVDPGFAELVNAGRFRNVSASFWAGDSANNPKPGALYLRHVGFLGAQPPAVKGLKPVSFSETEAGIFSFTSNNEGKKTMTEEEIKAAEVKMREREKALATAQAKLDADKLSFAESGKLAVQADKLKADADKLEAQAKDLAKREADITAREVSDYAEGLIKAGKIRPADKSAVVSILVAMPREMTISFTEGDADAKDKSAGDAFRAFLDSRPKLVEFGEMAGDKRNPEKAGDGETDYKKAGETIAQHFTGGK